jgi:hypothetical protein
MKLIIPVVASGLFVGTNLLAVPIDITTAVGGQSVEAVVFNQSSASLSLIGTYDFKNGEVHNGIQSSSGAIFLRTPGNSGWNYAYVLNFNNQTYTLCDKFFTLNSGDEPGSRPWTIDPTTAHLLGTGSFSYSTGKPDPFGLDLHHASGAMHNEIDLSLDLLPEGIRDSFEVHFMVSRGNNSIDGHFLTDAATVPDGGGTAGLLGAVSLAVVFLRRKSILL